MALGRVGQTTPVFGICYLAVAGPSMEPTLRAGDWIVARADGRAGVGDVVVLEHPHRPGVLIVKRVARTDEDGFWLLGDAPGRQPTPATSVPCPTWWAGCCGASAHGVQSASPRPADGCRVRLGQVVSTILPKRSPDSMARRASGAAAAGAHGRSAVAGRSRHTWPRAVRARHGSPWSSPPRTAGGRSTCATVGGGRDHRGRAGDDDHSSGLEGAQGV